MISLWWILLAIPIFFVGHIMGYSKCLRVHRRMSRVVRKLLLLDNVERAIKILDVVEGVTSPKEQRIFDERLKKLDDE